MLSASITCCCTEESSPAGLLKKTEAMREQRRVERLADYYRRNFRDYLNFDSGAAKNRVRLFPCGW